MKFRLTLCVFLAGCAAHQGVHWPAGKVPATPALLSVATLGQTPTGTAEARGAVLAAQVAALRARMAALAQATP